MPDKLDGFFKQTFNRYFPDIEQYAKKTEPFLSVLASAHGPLPAEMGRQILKWSQRELTINVTEPMGSLLQKRNGRLVFFHASLVDWLKDPSRSGTHCVDDSGIYELADFLWRDRETATRDLLLGQDQFTELWVERSAWTKQIIVQGYSPRYWLNMSQNEAKELAKNTHALDKEIEYARRLVSLAYEAWGGGHDIFELAKAEWEELRDRLQQ